MTEDNTSTGKGKGRQAENPDFPKNVRAIFREKGIKSKDVAQAMGVTESSFNATLSGNPTVNMLRGLADVLGCDVMDFFKPEAKHQPKADPEKGNDAQLTSLTEFRGKFYKASNTADLRRIADEIDGLR